MDESLMEKLTALGKRRGFIYPGSELYGGLANTYDYGPVGTELLRNIRNVWWDTFVHRRDDIVGLDASLISHQKVWEASGHTTGFADALIDCKSCKSRIRADHLIEGYLEDNPAPDFEGKPHSPLTLDTVNNYIKTKKVEGLSIEQLEAIIKLHHIKCPVCENFDWTSVRKFNLLFPVHLGIVEGDQSLAYLRGETAQGMFINFKNVVNSTRVRLPFGIAQQGKGFRNEITPGNSVFRTIEFDMAEIEYFFDPEASNWEELYEEWKKQMWDFVIKKLGVNEENLRWREHDEKERSFYSKRTEDLEYKFPFGFKELWGLSYRTDYDLTQHQNVSKKDLTIVDPQSGKKVLPYVIEPAVGINRLLLVVLLDAYTEEDKRIVLKLRPGIAPIKVAVFPLLANKEDLVKTAREIYKNLKKQLNGAVAFDDRGNIGKRYLSQDEIGTPFCVTVDFQTLEDKTVTVRDRNTTKQERVTIADLVSSLAEKLA